MSEGFETLDFESLFPELGAELDAEGSENNLEDGEDEGVENADEETVEEDSADEGEEEGEDEEPTDSFELEIDGKKVSVTLDELKSGYLRQSDYTKKTQELKDVTNNPAYKALEAELKEAEAGASFADHMMYQVQQDFGTVAGYQLLAAVADDGNGNINPQVIVEEIGKFLEAASVLHPEVARQLGREDNAATRARVLSRIDLLDRGSNIAAAERETSRNQKRQAATTAEDEWATGILTTVKLATEGAGLDRKASIAAANEIVELANEGKVKDLNAIAMLTKLVVDKYAANAPAAKKTVRKKTPVSKPSGRAASKPGKPTMDETILSALRG